MNVIILDVPMHKKIMINLSDDKGNGERALKEVLKVRNWDNGNAKESLCKQPFCEKGAKHLYKRESVNVILRLVLRTYLWDHNCIVNM